MDEGLLVVKGNDLIAVEDIDFDSPTSAASVMIGTQVNGLEYWINEEGRSMKELRDANEVAQ